MAQYLGNWIKQNNKPPSPTTKGDWWLFFIIMEKLVSEKIKNRVYEIYEELMQSKFDECYAEHLEDYPDITNPEALKDFATEDAEREIAEEAVEKVIEEIKVELMAAWFNV